MSKERIELPLVMATLSSIHPVALLMTHQKSGISYLAFAIFVAVAIYQQHVLVQDQPCLR